MSGFLFYKPRNVCVQVGTAHIELSWDFHSLNCEPNLPSSPADTSSLHDVQSFRTYFSPKKLVSTFKKGPLQPPREKITNLRPSTEMGFRTTLDADRNEPLQLGSTLHLDSLRAGQTSHVDYQQQLKELSQIQSLNFETKSDSNYLKYRSIKPVGEGSIPVDSDSKLQPPFGVHMLNPNHAQYVPSGVSESHILKKADLEPQSTLIADRNHMRDWPIQNNILEALSVKTPSRAIAPSVPTQAPELPKRPAKSNLDSMLDSHAATTKSLKTNQLAFSDQKVLDLSGMALRALWGAVKWHLYSSIQELRARRNQFPQLDESVVRTPGNVLSKLQSLDLAFCEIHTFLPSALRNLSHLTVLNLSNNEISELPYLDFEPPPLKQLLLRSVDCKNSIQQKSRIITYDNVFLIRIYCQS